MIRSESAVGHPAADSVDPLRWPHRHLILDRCDALGAAGRDANLAAADLDGPIYLAQVQVKIELPAALIRCNQI